MCLGYFYIMEWKAFGWHVEPRMINNVAKLYLLHNYECNPVSPHMFWLSNVGKSREQTKQELFSFLLTSFGVYVLFCFAFFF